MSIVKKYFKILLCICLIFIINLHTLSFGYEEEEETDYIWLQEEITKTSTEVSDEPVLNSRCAVCFDRNSKEVLFGKNENKRVPMASTTKIMTAIVLLEALEENDNLSLDTEVEVCRDAGGIGGSRLGLKTGDKITINDLLYGLMLCSGNDCSIQVAVSIAGSVEEFSNLMNKKAEELGLKDSHFITPHGLDKEEHYTTAYELAVISDYALNNPKFSEVVSTKTHTVYINGYSKTISNTNELLGYLNGVNGVKTGFTNGAGRCLVTSVNRNNFNIITVVLGADTKKFRTKDSIKLIEYVYSNYEIVDLEELIDIEYREWLNINKNRVNVYKAKENNIDIRLEEYKNKKYPIKKDNIKDIKIDIKNIKLDFEAPVYKGEKIANIALGIGNKEIINTNIIIDNNIARKDVKNYLKEILCSIM